MTERPITFSSEMIAAILNGIKTQTRRIITLPTKYRGQEVMEESSIYKEMAVRRFGKKGDVLWVRESFDCICTLGNDGEKVKNYIYNHPKDMAISSLYLMAKMKSPRFMPKEACRIKLEIKSIEVEKLHDISEKALKAEGVRLPVNSKGQIMLRVTGKFPPSDYFKIYSSTGINKYDYLRAHYASLWDSLNFKKARWSSNPFVWVIKFRRINE